MDYFRGYAVLGMLVVNFLGNFQCTPRILKHTNDYCSYADTIMPHFFFAVGFSLQWVWRKRTHRSIHDPSSSPQRNSFWSWLAKRTLFLVLVSLLLYFPWSTHEFVSKLPTGAFWFSVVKRDWFQTLLHIAVTSVWYAPFLRFSAGVQMLWLTFSAVLHGLLSYWFYFDFVHASPRAIDGGPLGFLTWSIPLGIGALCCRSYQLQFDSKLVRTWIVFGTAIMFGGYCLSCLSRCYDVPSQERPPREWVRLAEPPFVPPPSTHERQSNYWMMSQRAGTPSYLLFAGGLSLLLFAGIFALSKNGRYPLPVLKELGQSALMIYVVHGYLAAVWYWQVPRTASCSVAVTALVTFLFANIAIAVVWNHRSRILEIITGRQPSS